MLCDLHMNDVISTDMVQAFQKNYENSVSNPENIRQAAKDFGEIEVFKRLPTASLLTPFQRNLPLTALSTTDHISVEKEYTFSLNLISGE